MDIQIIVIWTMRAALIIGIVFIAFLLIRHVKKQFITKVGLAQLNKQKKFAPYNGIVAFCASFLDVLGIGSYATTTAAVKIRGSIDDINIPGTLNAGFAIPVCVEGLLFIGNIEADILTLVVMILSSVIGSFIGAKIVSGLNRTAIRIGVGVGLISVGFIMICKQTGIGPFGLTGTATGLLGFDLVIAGLVCFILGGLMNLGVGMYAPTFALVTLLGMDTTVAFPVMFGSCAYLMAFGSGPKFIKTGRIDTVACLLIASIGTIGVIVCYSTVYKVLTSNINILFWVITVIVFLTAILFLKDGIKDIIKFNKCKQHE